MPSAGDDPVTGSVIVLLGPTAVGKSALALILAQAFNGEIVSVDSRLVYIGMDIGVAKPTPAEQALVPHHLLDIVTPAQTLSLATFQRLAYRTINDILRRGCLPLLVGGTGQYISAVIEGWNIPEVRPNPTLRAELEAYAAQHGSTALWERLRQCDPEAATRIHPHNVRRVVRALEVFLESGQPISTQQRRTPPPYRILQIGLTRPRHDLHARIDARIDQMLASGLLEEVQGLLAAGFDRRCPAMSGLGYRQIIAYLEGECALEEAIAALRRETRDFARRQDVWFRKYNRDAYWFDMTETPAETIIEFVRQWLESEPHAPSKSVLPRDK